jgi:glycosyltransferase involved in cell wall biosynthesis
MEKTHHPGNIHIDNDIIIWGTIYRYKGVHCFLKYIHENTANNKYRILIAGKIADKECETEILKYKSDTITIYNEYIDNEYLSELIGKSRIILFTYHREHVLSSGSLADSVSYGKFIVGPDVGAFKDLKEMGLVFTYRTFAELIGRLDDLIGRRCFVNTAHIEHYIQQNSWANYARTFTAHLETIT